MQDHTCCKMDKSLSFACLELMLAGVFSWAVSYLMNIHASTVGSVCHNDRRYMVL